MAIKLTTIDRTFAPDVSFPDDDRGLVANRDLPEAEKVVGEITLATIGQKTRYLGSYTVADRGIVRRKEVKQYTDLQYEACVRKHVTSIRGLEEFGIVDGKSLVSHQPTPELDEIIKEFFFKVNGIHADDLYLSDEGISDSAEFTPGE